jgi:SAM-dependent methyltransferase
MQNLFSQKNLTASDEKLCLSCGASSMSIFYKLDDVPVHSVLLLKTRKDAVNYPRANINLRFCSSCGFISNVIFDPSLHEYSSRYEETQGFSSRFNTFHRSLADYLIERYDLHDKNIIEIGCGKGEFLNLLCELGGNRGIGFDPAYVTMRNGKKNDQVTFIKDFFSEKYFNYTGDFICCKMTLEHIKFTADFLAMIRRHLEHKHDAIVFFQVPDVIRILKEIAFWDIYYEHCSYFSPGSLARLLRKCGFEVINLWKDYGQQYLMIEAQINKSKFKQPHKIEEEPGKLALSIKYFSRNHKKKLNEWKSRLRYMKRKGQKTIIWGAGSKGVAFLTTLNAIEEINYVVDINPYRQGTYMAGTGQEIVSEDFLKEYKPDIVIVMNPIYVKEISQSIARMALNTEIITV